MNIGVFHNLYGEFSRGGAETAVEMALRDLRADGHQVFLITTKPRGAKPLAPSVPADLKIYYLDSKFYNLAEISITARLFWHLSNIFSWQKYQKIKKILATEKPDLVITHNLMGLGFLTPPAIRSLKIKQAHFLHDIQLLHPSGLMLWGQEKKIDSLGAKIYQILTRALFASPAKVISPSAWLLELHKQHGFFKDSEYEIRPFVWPKTEPIISRQSARGKNFLFIGQIEEQKGIFLLINAFKKIIAPDCRLTVAIRGGGQKIAAAKKSAADDKRIEFLGPLSYEETEKLKAVSDCLIVPSLCYENSPTTIYGARAAGLPVIAAAIGGIPEIVGPSDTLFRPGDENDLREKMTRFIKKEF